MKSCKRKTIYLRKYIFQRWINSLSHQNTKKSKRSIIYKILFLQDAIETRARIIDCDAMQEEIELNDVEAGKLEDSNSTAKRQHQNTILNTKSTWTCHLMISARLPPVKQVFNNFYLRQVSSATSGCYFHWITNRIE